MLVAVVVYSAVQAFVLLAIAEVALPHSWTGGQGSLSMWCVPDVLLRLVSARTNRAAVAFLYRRKQVYEHPGLLLNAVTNTVYWAAQVYVLREVRGVLVLKRAVRGRYLLRLSRTAFYTTH